MSQDRRLCPKHPACEVRYLAHLRECPVCAELMTMRVRAEDAELRAERAEAPAAELREDLAAARKTIEDNKERLEQMLGLIVLYDKRSESDETPVSP